MAKSVKTTILKIHCVLCCTSMNLWLLCEYYLKIIRWIIVVRAYKFGFGCIYTVYY